MIKLNHNLVCFCNIYHVYLVYFCSTFTRKLVCFCKILLQNYYKYFNYASKTAQK